MPVTRTMTIEWVAETPEWGDAYLTDVLAWASTQATYYDPRVLALNPCVTTTEQPIHPHQFALSKRRFTESAAARDRGEDVCLSN